ncbi:hypothetical protein B484DRAFT_145736 [Ochromonadaceae sp. CCMP2298]|nr:hypothetical protein B484DRAFT_145736 [Ochromonadaceae sp. CCMP2298]
METDGGKKGAGAGVGAGTGAGAGVGAAAAAVGDGLQTLRIRGANSKVSAAKARLVQIVGEFVSNSLQVQVTDDLIPIILGKGGADIRAMRERFPEASIDIDGLAVHVQSPSAETREQIKVLLEALVEANYTQQVNLSESAVLQLMRQAGAGVREQLKSVKMIIDKSNMTVKLRGERGSVAEGAEVLFYPLSLCCICCIFIPLSLCCLFYF